MAALTVGKFMQSVYASITQQASTLLVGDESMIAFINMALNDLFAFDGKIWTFKWKDSFDISEPAEDGKPYYDVTLPTPMCRASVLYDKGTKATAALKVLGSKTVDDTKWQPGVLFFRPMSTTLRVARNSGAGYILDYVQWFNPISAKTDELPISDPFTSPLHAFVLSYIFPLYAQYGEGKETSQYQVAVARMKELMKNDFVQVQNVTSGVR
jgi:hypothetical protein